MTEQTSITPDDTELSHALIPADGFGIPSFTAYFEAVCQTVPQHVLDMLPTMPGREGTPQQLDAERRHAAALTYVIDALAANIVETYSDAGLVSEAMVARLQNAIIHFSADLAAHQASQTTH